MLVGCSANQSSSLASPPTDLVLPETGEVVKMRVSDYRNESSSYAGSTTMMSGIDENRSLFKNLFEKGFYQSEAIDSSEVDIDSAPESVYLLFETEDESKYVYYFYVFSDDEDYCYFEDSQNGFALYKAPVDMWNYLQKLKKSDCQICFIGA